MTSASTSAIRPLDHNGPHEAVPANLHRGESGLARQLVELGPRKRAQDRQRAVMSRESVAAHEPRVGDRADVRGPRTQHVIDDESAARDSPYLPEHADRLGEREVVEG